MFTMMYVQNHCHTLFMNCCIHIPPRSVVMMPRTIRSPVVADAGLHVLAAGRDDQAMMDRPVLVSVNMISIKFGLPKK